MRILRTPVAMQRAATAAQQQRQQIGLVPTMGYLHDGHLSLVKVARQQVGTDGLVVLSIYVNPTQFGPTEDLSKYPRDFRRDTALCRQAGVDVIFAPANLYPDQTTGEYSTYVVEETLSHGLEGSSRPTHFRGVTTVVAKLFNCVKPDVAVFGAKDWQQAAVVKRMVKDLNFDLQLVVAPTHREPDGLAMSSRNKYLNPAERAQATVLWRAQQAARRAIVAAKNQPIPAASLKAQLQALITTEPLARLDYVEFFHPTTLQPVTEVRRGTQLAMAVYLGKTRLIDNGRL